MPNPFNQENIEKWDKLIIGEIIFPGLVQDCNISVNNNWEIKENRGTRAGKAVFVGTPLKELTYSILIYNEEEYQKLEDIVSVDGIWSNLISGKEHYPLQIVHPKANRLGVNTVVLTSIDEGYPTQNGFIISLTLLEWQEERVGKQTPKVKKQTGPDKRETNPLVNGEQLQSIDPSDLQSI